ncbi:MAG: hypothetical protein J0I13_12635 [Rhizobiales bacterium]|nr:hypothetical protein [Hyphomicrobiales bacterium]
MSTAAPAATLRHLREALAGIDPSLTPRLSDRERRVGLGASIDAVLGGGLAFGLLHEFAPAAPMHLAAASGFALALAARAARTGGEVLWIATGFAMSEGRVRSMCSGRWKRGSVVARWPASLPN